MQASTALSHIKVIDLTRVRAGPTCVRHLADWGADIIRIEQRVGNVDLPIIGSLEYFAAGPTPASEGEVHVEAGRRTGRGDGHDPEDKPSAQVFQQEQCEHEGKHGAVSSQDQ